MGVFDWITEKVQDFSGETDRRQFVSELKTKVDNFKLWVKERVNRINNLINNFNNTISGINQQRQARVNPNVGSLYQHLRSFGNVSEPKEYIAEEYMENIELPERDMNSYEEYISSVDWSQDEIFANSMKKGILGTKIATQQLNLEIRSRIDQLEIYQKNLNDQFNEQEKMQDLSNKIAELYLQVISMIAYEIENIIIPGLETVNSFMLAKHVADCADCPEQITQTEVIYNTETLENTKYRNFNVFMKNSLLFYVMAVKIVNTQVLTNLLNNQVSENDIVILTKHIQAIKYQKERINLV